MKVLALVLMVLTVAAAWMLGSAARGEDDVRTMYCVIRDADSVLNVRVTPIDGRVCCGLYQGQAVGVLRIRNGWAEVDYAGEYDTGWCDARYLSDEKPYDAPREMTVTSPNGARVRVRQYMGGPRIRWARCGDTVRVIGFVTDDHGTRWATLEDSGVIGAEYLQEDNNQANGESLD